MNGDEFILSLIPKQVGNEFVNKGQNKDQVVNSIGALSKSVSLINLEVQEIKK